MAGAPWTAPPGWLRLFIKLNAGVQRLGVPQWPTQMLTLRGRTSDRPRTTPVAPLTVDGQRYVIDCFAHGDWVAICTAR